MIGTLDDFPEEEIKQKTEKHHLYSSSGPDYRPFGQKDRNQQWMTLMHSKLLGR